MLYLQLLVALSASLYPDTSSLAFSPTTPAVMLDIARCESQWRQYKPNGKPLVSKTNDVGIYQINKSHAKEAKKLGYDINTPEGNTAYALYLYHTQGTKPWSSSEHCWNA